MAYGQDPYGQQPGGYGQQPGGYGQPSGAGGYGGQPPYSGGGGYGGSGQPGGPSGEVSVGKLVACFLLFWPMAIFVLIKNNEGKNAALQGNAAGAQEAFANANRLAKINIIIGSCWYGLICLCTILYIIFVVILAGSAATSSY
ncbi:hypothetical protein [Fodinicola acaciae]|uniref:hypothetical protein n=1 Tax=Fodinicola acaciae TaxID=2681555 RepID=UPI0013D24347|nr:hypothetical protein [Fodinicola acaciae]